MIFCLNKVSVSAPKCAPTWARKQKGNWKGLLVSDFNANSINILNDETYVYNHSVLSRRCAWCLLDSYEMTLLTLSNVLI